MTIISFNVTSILYIRAGYYCYGQYGKYSFYEFVAVSALIFVIVFFVVFFFRLDRYLIGCINLPLSFLINDAIFSILYVIASILLFTAIGSCYHGQGARIAASIFGVLAFLSFGATAIDDYRWLKSGSAPLPLSQSASTVQPA